MTGCCILSWAAADWRLCYIIPAQITWCCILTPLGAQAQGSDPVPAVELSGAAELGMMGEDNRCLVLKGVGGARFIGDGGRTPANPAGVGLGSAFFVDFMCAAGSASASAIGEGGQGELTLAVMGTDSEGLRLLLALAVIPAESPEGPPTVECLLKLVVGCVVRRFLSRVSFQTLL
jgi:hypothetical protein